MMTQLKDRLKIAFERAPSKRAIAAACKVSDQAITGWQKTGKVDHAHMPAIAKICNVRLQWLMAGEGEMLINCDKSSDNNYTEKDAEILAREFWKLIEPYKSLYGPELPEPLPVEFKQHMLTALTRLERVKSVS